MTDIFTPGARELVRDAGARARSLGHRRVGDEHLLLALAAHDGPPGEVIRSHGLTVPRIEQCIPAMTNQGQGERLFDSLDRDALASVGIDLDTVRDAVESSFGPTAFRPRSARARRFPPRTLVRFVRRRRRHAGLVSQVRDTTGAATSATRSEGALVDVDHLALRLATIHRGAAHEILTTLGVSEARLANDLLTGLRRAG